MHMDGNQENQNNGQQQTELNPDLAGYPSVEALVAGYRASGNEAKKLRERTEALEQQLRQVYQPQYEPNARQAVPQRASNSPYDRLAEYGVPADAIKELVTTELQNALQPIADGFQARNTLLSRHSDYQKFESDVAMFIQSDPQLNQTYQRMFQSDPVGAMEYAFLKFGDSRRRSYQSNGDNPDAGAVHASIPSSRNGDARNLNTQPDAAVAAAYKRYVETGSSDAARDYAKARLRTVISDEFLNT